MGQDHGGQRDLAGRCAPRPLGQPPARSWPGASQASLEQFLTFVEFDKKAAQIPDPQSLDGKVALMLLAFEADVKFSKSVRKSTDASPKQETQTQTVEQAEAEPEETSDEPPMTGEAKLKAAKDFAKGMIGIDLKGNSSETITNEGSICRDQ